jgi:hypothetical protein
VDVAVAGVAEAGDGEAVTLAEAGGEAGEVDEAAAGDDDVFVEFCEAGAFEGFGEFAAELPEAFAGFVAVSLLEVECAVGAQEGGEGGGEVAGGEDDR